MQNNIQQSAHESKLNQLLTDQLISIKNYEYKNRDSRDLVR